MTNPSPGEEQSSAERPGDELVAADAGGDSAAHSMVLGQERAGMFGVHGTGDTSGFGGLRLPAYSPAPAERPYGGWFDDFADELLAAMTEQGIPGTAIRQVTVDRGEITIYVRPDRILEMCKLLRDGDGLRFELCSSVSGVDYGEDIVDRFHVVYHLTSMTFRRRIRLAGAGDLGHVRADLRRPPGADPDPDAGRLGRPPAAQGLPARRDRGGVQGRRDTTARHPKGVLVMIRGESARAPRYQLSPRTRRAYS
jgi:NADH-quinone oxidoreductase subunit C